MKKILVSTLVSCLFLFSCKKEREEPLKEVSSNGKKYEVKFNVSDFKQSVGTFSTKSSGKLMATAQEDSLAAHIKYLFYFIYDSEGKELFRYMQTQNGYITKYDYLHPWWDPDLNEPTDLPTETGWQGSFGSLTDSLASGTYTAIIVGSEDNLFINRRSQVVDDPVTRPLSSASFTFSKGLDAFPRAKDTFFKKFTLTVGSSDATEDIALDRIVGKMEINIEDAIPQNASYFRLLFDNEMDSYMFDTEKPSGGTVPDLETANHPILESEKGMTNYKFSKLFINTETPIYVTLECYDSSNSLLGSVEADVRIYKNKRTILTGKLFESQDNTQSFHVSVNSEWDTDSTTVEF